MPRPLSAILADVAAIDDTTSPATLRQLRHELAPTFASGGSPRIVDNVTWPAMPRVVQLIVTGWFYEYLYDRPRFLAFEFAA